MMETSFLNNVLHIMKTPHKTCFCVFLDQLEEREDDISKPNPTKIPVDRETTFPLKHNQDGNQI